MEVPRRSASADLLLLEADPLADVGNVACGAEVVLRGRQEQVPDTYALGSPLWGARDLGRTSAEGADGV